MFLITGKRLRQLQLDCL